MSRTNRADHPRERILVLREAPPPDDIAPLRILPRADGKLIVYDPRRPAGNRTFWEGDSMDAALAAARSLR